MELKRMKLLAVIVCIQILKIFCRSVEELEVKKGDGDESQTIELHVITKRDVLGDFQQDYPRVDGRTFRASEPLDPNSPRSHQAEPPQNLLDGFEVESEIFQPQVEADGASDVARNTDSAGVEHSSDDDEENEEKQSESAGAGFGAQYPYAETTVAGQHSTGRQPYPYTDSRQVGSIPYRHQTGDGVQQTVTSRRVVVAGREPDPSETGYDGQQHSQTYRSSPSYSSSNQYPSQRQYPGYQGTGYQTSRTEVRGPYYGGERFIDSSGHYVDAQGRHLDSTGRYYDISGRYPDAIMTRTSAYHTSGEDGSSRYGSSGSGYYDSEGRYVSAGSSRGYQDHDRRYTSDSRSSGGHYDSEGRYVSGSNRGGYYDSQGRYVSTSAGTYDDTGSSRFDTSQSRPVDSYGGTQFYSSGNRYQTQYDPITSNISDDPTCPTLNTRILINGQSCTDAVAQIGSFVCYSYERVSTECCERCLQVKRADQVGCEYGDRSYQCRTINPFDCYNDRNRQVCCERCQQFRERSVHGSQAGCEYGDLTPRCQTMLQRPYLCYLPENSRICCSTCPRLANSAEPDCKWGNQSPELCEPFDENRRLKINCYLDAVQEICCSTCKSLRERVRENIPGCEYGDAPVLFYSGANTMTCSEYIRQYDIDMCNDPEIAQKCCYTCYRYRRARG